MQRQSFLRTLALLPFVACKMKLNDLHKATGDLSATDKMPVFFFGHGSPMNAIEENEFSKGWQATAANLPKPNAILCISAHWETRGTFVTAMEKPRTIHDFGGFPRELFEVEYAAPGSPAIATETQAAIKSTPVGLDQSWGLDHGCWSVVKHLYPNADVPVLQLSLDRTQSPQWHYQLAKELAVLRRKGVLIVGSGNIVHNLGVMNWRTPEQGYDWADVAHEKIKKLIVEGNHTALADYQSLGREVQLSVPTPEHYLPLLYTLGLQETNEEPSFFNDKTVYGSIAMTSVKIA